MKENKQIDEMAKRCPYYHNGECCADATNICKCDLMCGMFGVFANLEAAGYRKQEWISVKDALPEEKVMVLGFYHRVFKGGGHNDLVLVMELQNGLFVPFNCSPIKNGSVTHWMPLPTAPKGE